MDHTKGLPSVIAPYRPCLFAHLAPPPLPECPITQIFRVVTAILEHHLWWKQAGKVTAAASSLQDSNLSQHWWVNDATRVMAANRGHFVCFHLLLVLALVSHASVTAADPGFYPADISLRPHGQWQRHTRWCDHCNAPKPPRAHHCSRCGACVARMDHHCIYAANCVGAGNQKQFILLLLYSAASVAYAIFLLFRFGATRDSVGSWEATLPEASDSSSPLGHAVALLTSGHGVTWVGGSLLLLLSWLVVLLAFHLYGLVIDAGKVDRMQASSTKGRRTESEATYNTASTWSDGSERMKRAGRMTADRTSSIDMDAGTVTSFGVHGRLPNRSGHGTYGRAAGRSDDGFVNRCTSNSERYISRWTTFRQEVLGDGPWWMWFVPSPAKLAPEVRGRVYALH